MNSDWIKVVRYWTIDSNPTKKIDSGNTIIAMIRAVSRLMRRGATSTAAVRFSAFFMDSTNTMAMTLAPASRHFWRSVCFIFIANAIERFYLVKFRVMRTHFPPQAFDMAVNGSVIKKNALAVGGVH